MMIKKNNGFTLVEVLLALLVLATSTYILSGLQVRSLTKLRRSRELIERAYLLKRQLYKFFISPPQNEKPVKIQYEEPELSIIAERKPIVKNSSLFKISPNLYLVSSQGTWKSGGLENTSRMVSVMFIPPKKAKK